MAEIASGNPYDAGQAGSGVGAVMFTPNHRDITDIGADWNRQNAADEAAAADAEKEKAKNARLLIGDLNLDTKGALDSDAPYLRQRLTDIIGNRAGLLKAYSGNPTSEEALTAAASTDADKNIFRSEVNQSAGHKEQVIKATATLDADKMGDAYDKDATALNIAKFRAASLPDRQKMLDTGNGSLLVQAVPKIDKIAKESLAHPDKVMDGSVTRLPNGDYEQKIIETHSPERIQQIAQNDYQYNRDVTKWANGMYENASPDEQARLTRMAQQQEELDQRQGKIKRTVPPQEVLVKNYYDSKNDRKESVKDHPVRWNPYDLALYRHNLREGEKGDSYILQQGNNVLNGLEDVFDRSPVAERAPVDVTQYKEGNFDSAPENGTQLNPDEYSIAPFFTGKKNGTTTIKIPKTVKQGNKTVQETDGSGRPVYEYKPIDNDVYRVIGLGQYGSDNKLKGTSPMIADAKSLIEAGIDPNTPESEWKNNPAAYRPFTKGELETFARNNGVKDADMAKFYKMYGAYGQRVTRTEKASDAGAKRVGQGGQTSTPATPAPTTKKVSTATLQSKIGTKGYEGYTLDELKKYYEGQGYKIE